MQGLEDQIGAEWTGALSWRRRGPLSAVVGREGFLEEVALIWAGVRQGTTQPGVVGMVRSGGNGDHSKACSQHE